MAALYWIVRERLSAPMAIALAVAAAGLAVVLVAVVLGGGGGDGSGGRGGRGGGEQGVGSGPRATAGSGPPASATTPGAAAALAQAARTHELAGPPVRQHVVGGWRSPVQAVTVFADTYINWTAATVSDRLRALGEVSVGQARSMVTLAAAETAQDSELQHGGVANSGVVEGVAALPGHPGEYVVVTRERTTATGTTAYAGLAPAWHVTLATVTPVAGGLWVLSAWQPES